MKKRKWSPYNKPFRPQKPLKILTGTRTILSFSLRHDDIVKISPEHQKLLQTATECCIKIEDDDTVYLRFKTNQEQENPNYEQQLEAYKIKYAEYREELKWWNTEKKKKDAIEAEKIEAKDKREYERLKAKYEN